MKKTNFYNQKKYSYKTTDAYYEAAHLGSGNARFLLASLKGKFVNIQITQALKHLPNRMYLISGANISHTEQIIDEYTAINSSIKENRIANTKHLPQLEDPAAFVSLINEYLK